VIRSIVSSKSLLSALLVVVLFVGAGAGEVSITLIDGRTLVGEVDSHSDARNLWLRRGDATTTIRRSIAWSQIASARVGERPLTVEQLRAAANAAPPPVPRQAATATPPGAGTLRTWRIPGVAAARETRPAAVVRSLDVDASLANWDADVEADGLVLSFAALDEFGAAASVDGTLEVELVGERLPPYSRGNAFPTLGRWTLAVDSATGETGGGYYRARLDFQAVHPDFQLYLPRYALVHVRLSVPGQGTFDASQDGLSLRGFTPVRDRVEAAAGTRFLPNERTGRSSREASQTAP
jgi:hypothetical protein